MSRSTFTCSDCTYEHPPPKLPVQKRPAHNAPTTILASQAAMCCRSIDTATCCCIGLLVAPMLCLLWQLVAMAQQKLQNGQDTHHKMKNRRNHTYANRQRRRWYRDQLRPCPQLSTRTCAKRTSNPAAQCLSNTTNPIPAAIRAKHLAMRPPTQKCCMWQLLMRVVNG